MFCDKLFRRSLSSPLHSRSGVFSSLFHRPENREDSLKEGGVSRLDLAILEKNSWEDMQKENWSWIFTFSRQKHQNIFDAKVIYEKVVVHGVRPNFVVPSLPVGTFPTFLRLAFLHLWIIDVRFRAVNEKKIRNFMTGNFVEWLWEDIELGIADVLKTNNPLIISKHSRRYLHQWFGTELAYDYGMITSDCSFAESLWRNMFDGNPDVTLQELSDLVHYIRKTQYMLANLSNEEFIDAKWDFPVPTFRTTGTALASSLLESNLDGNINSE